MAESTDGTIEQKMAGCNDDLPNMKRLAGVLKTKFTNSCIDAASILSRLQRNLDDAELSARATAQMVAVRRFREDVLRAYEILALHNALPEQLFTSDYKPKLAEMREKLEELEDTYSTCAAESRELRRERAAAQGAVAGAEAGGAGGGRKWKFEAAFQPKQKLSMEMTQVEIAGWKRSWKSFYTISELYNAPIDLVRLTLMGTLEENLVSRVETSLLECESIGEMLQVIEEEIILRNPKIVSRFQWMKTRQRGDEKYTDFLARENTLRTLAAIPEMTTETWIAHVQMQGCNNEDLLKELLKIKEDELTESTIKETATRWELINATKKGLRNSEEKPGKVRQVKTKGKDSGQGTCLNLP